MKSVVVVHVLVLALITGACAPMYGSPGLFGPQRPPGTAYGLPTQPVGRWDAVMALEPGAIIGVMAADGMAHTGRFTRAGMYWIRLYENGAEIELARQDVARVDLLKGVQRGVRTREVLGGALALAGALAGTEMFLGLVFAGEVSVPSGESLAAAAAGGAAAGALSGLGRERGRTVYVAPEIAGRW